MVENWDIVFEFDLRSQPNLGKSLNDKDSLLQASRYNNNITLLKIQTIIKFEVDGSNEIDVFVG